MSLKLPDYPVLRLQADLRQSDWSRIMVIHAAPGSGKSTLVPLMLADILQDGTGTIILLQPRRAAARAIAGRLSELGQPHYSVGYQTAEDRYLPRSSRIIVMTEGIFIRKLISNPELKGISAVILDEFHERSLDLDASYALLRSARELFRPDLPMLIMSATLDRDLFTGSDFIHLEALGSSHPLSIHYAPAQDDPVTWAARKALSWIEAQNSGSVLVFLPGEAEIRKAESWLKERCTNEVGRAEIQILPLFSRLKREDQRKALEDPAPGIRRIILSTNIAETSLTIQGIRCVVDSGLRRTRIYDPARAMDRMHTTRISRASADQRSGRAGRLGPGTAFRLWHEMEQLDPFDSPACEREALDSLLLYLASWGDIRTEAYDWPSELPASRVADARQLLYYLGAIDRNGNISPKGRRMADLPVAPRLASMLIDCPPGLYDHAAHIAAYISEDGDASPARGMNAGPDIEMMLQSPAAHSHRILQQKKKILSILGKNSPPDPAHGHARWEPSQRTPGLLMQMYPERIARRLETGAYQMKSGGICRLSQSDTGFAPEWLVAINLSLRGSTCIIHLAAALSPELIGPYLESEIEEERLLLLERNKIRGILNRRWGAIGLSRTNLSLKSFSDELQPWISLIEESDPGLWGWSRASRRLQTRLDFLFRQLGDPWPDVSPDRLKASAPLWLPSILPDLISGGKLENIDMSKLFEILLPWNLRSQLSTLAPESLTLPQGKTQALRYEENRVILSVRIQDAFGLNENPHICGIPVEVELLSPAMRPVQITRDMPSFWNSAYPQIRKELRGRYVKHAWPEDPLSSGR